ncbi:MAG: D-aminoacyl-tRNA deacylase [Candidatus Micrarchaeia archaeon]
MPTIVFSSQDVAGKNIAEKLINQFKFEKKGEKWVKGELELIQVETKLVDAEQLYEKETDFLVFISKHKSETGKPCLTAHTPGNWGAAELGGKPKQLCPCFPSKLKIVLREMNSLNDLGWQVCAEVDHHGPLTKAPALFVEIGSTEREWQNQRAGEIVAFAVMKMLSSNQTFPAVFGIGGGHYAPSFTKVILEEEYAVGHMLPKYCIDEVDFECFKQGVEKSKEKIETALLDWKGMKKEQRDKVIEFLKLLKLTYKRI